MSGFDPDKRNTLKLLGASALGLAAGAFPEAARGQTPVPKTLLRAHLVYEYGTGEVLSAENEHTPCNPASLTKLLPAAAFFKFKKEGLLSVSEKAIAAIEKEIRRSLIISDNYAAEKIAAFLTMQESIYEQAKKHNIKPGTEWAFTHLVADPMAEELGLEQTKLWTASGLPGDDKNVPFNVTTAAALAKLCDYIYANHPEIIEICAQPYVDAERKSGVNTNPLLQNSPRGNAKPYNGVDGLKTGHIDEAGFNLIASAVREDRRIIVISVGNRTPQERIESVTRLLDDGFAALDSKYKPAVPQQRTQSGAEFAYV